MLPQKLQWTSNAWEQNDIIWCAWIKDNICCFEKWSCHILAFWSAVNYIDSLWVLDSLYVKDYDDDIFMVLLWTLDVDNVSHNV